jgi:hypothetical protein
VGQLIGTGFAVGLNALEGLEFRTDRPHTCCRICGAVYQTDIDRHPEQYVNNSEFLSVEMVETFATDKRRRWSHKHSKSHDYRTHELLGVSGLWCTPQAAHKLAAFGIIPLLDMVLSNETEHALLESKAIPTDDAEGV